MARETPGVLGRLSQCLLRACRVEEAANGGDAIGRKACAPGMFLNARLVRCEVDAVHLVAGDVAMEPLDLGTHSLQNVDRLLGDFPQLGVGQIPSSGDFAFNDIFRHACNP
jgi:hypothetical protein